MTDESVAAQAGRMAAEAMAKNREFDLSDREKFFFGIEEYDRIAARRQKEEAEQEAIVNRTTVTRRDVNALLVKLRDLAELDAPERAHEAADKALLDFIGDRRVKEAFDAIDKWYA